MKVGKVTEPILKRSVLKTIGYKDSNIIVRGNVGNDAAVDYNGMVVASSTAGLLFSERSIFFDCSRCICNAMNNVTAEGGRVSGITVDIILPDKRNESELRELMRYISDYCKQYKINISGGNTEVSDSVNRILVKFTAFGKRMFSEQIDSKEWAASGDAIVMTKCIGISGTLALLNEKNEDYKAIFSPSYLSGIEAMKERMTAVNEGIIAIEEGVRVMHDLSRGGIYSGLWQLGEKTGKGIEVMLDNISVEQSTIELCEVYGINPYKMMSDGAMLMVTKNSDRLIRALESNGISAEMIGYLTDNNDRVLIKNEERRYIEPPKKDELEILFCNR